MSQYILVGPTLTGYPTHKLESAGHASPPLLFLLLRKMIMRWEAASGYAFLRKLSYLSNNCFCPPCIAALHSPLSEFIVKYCIIVSCIVHSLLPTRGTSAPCGSLPRSLANYIFRIPSAQISCQYNTTVTKLLHGIGSNPSFLHALGTLDPSVWIVPAIK